jgi:hypothetical protein
VGAEAQLPIRTFYPSSAHASDSTPLRVGWDRELADIDFELRPETSYCVAGRVVDAPAGGPCGSCVLRVSSTDDGYHAPIGSGNTIRDGSYRICGLASGTYRFSAINPASGSAGEGIRTVRVTKSNLRDVDVYLRAEGSVKGRLIFELTADDAKQKEAGVVMIQFRKADAPTEGSVAEVRADSTFEVKGLSAGTYRIQLHGLPAGGYLKELRLAGQPLPSPQVDVSEEGSPQLEVVAGFDSATLTVAVKRQDGTKIASPGTVIALFPADNSSPFVTEIRGRTGPNGSATVMSVPPGVYMAYAFTEAGAGEWGDPEIRRRNPSDGRLVEVGAGKRESLEIPLSPDIPDGM